MKKKTALVFRIQLLPRSETFISTQARAMRRYQPFFAGWRRVPGLDLPEDRSWVPNDGGPLGRLRELRFRYGGPSLRQTRRLLAEKPKVMYAHFALDAFAALPLADHLGLPLITALHGYDVTMHDDSLARTRLGREYLDGMKYLQERTSLFLTASEYLRRKAIERGFPAEKTAVHYIGVDVQHFQPPASQSREHIVLFVGRLVEKKGCGTLLDAMWGVQRSVPQAELVVVGEGPLRAQYEARAAELGLRCRFLGGQPPAVVRQWMERAAVFCVPSLVASSGDTEGFGIVFLEAQAMGVPVVSTTSGGIPEAVADGETGLLVKERDVPALTENIVRLLRDRELWERLSSAGPLRVREHFDLAKQTERLERRFDELRV